MLQAKITIVFNVFSQGIQNYSWIQHVFAAMTTHYDKPEVLRVACRSLQELIDVCPQVLDVVSDERGDDKIPLHQCIMTALLLHLDDPDLCQQAFQVIASLVNYSSSLRKVPTLHRIHFALHL